MSYGKTDGYGIRRNQQLGQTYPSATLKLRKLMLFHLAKKLNLDTCIRCGEKIETEKDFTLDHKRSWQGVSSDLFWDVENIGFSHHRCNSIATKNNGLPAERIKNAPERTSWCLKHAAYLPTTVFTKSKRSLNGFDSYCRACGKQRRKEIKALKLLGIKQGISKQP